MFKYQDGSDILIGDSVLYENGKTNGIVELIVTSEEEMVSIPAKRGRHRKRNLKYVKASALAAMA